MPILPKPFNWATKIRKANFNGRPGYFNAEDLNRLYDVILNYRDIKDTLVGYQSDIKFTITDLDIHQVVSAPETFSVSFKYAHTGGHVYAKGVRFNLPAKAETQYNQIHDQSTTLGPVDGISETPPLGGGGTDPVDDGAGDGSNLLVNTDGEGYEPPVLYFVLRSPLTTKTFQDDPILCGISADEHPALVPSSDHEVFLQEELVLTANPDAVQDKICIVATLLPRFADSTEPDSELQYSVFYNCRLPESFEVEGGVNAPTFTPKTNMSLMEEVHYLRSVVVPDLIQFIETSIGTDVANELKDLSDALAAEITARTQADTLINTNFGVSAWENLPLGDPDPNSTEIPPTVPVFTFSYNGTVHPAVPPRVRMSGKNAAAAVPKQVWLEGDIRTEMSSNPHGGNLLPLTVLPPAYRPNRRLTFYIPRVYWDGSSGYTEHNDITLALVILPNGQVTFDYTLTGVADSSFTGSEYAHILVSLTGISYWKE